MAPSSARKAEFVGMEAGGIGRLYLFHLDGLVAFLLLGGVDEVLFGG
jgi:hypothetical protein